MKALVFDTKNGAWENTTGFDLENVPEPTINESANPDDAYSVIIKVHFAGVCGSDRGIWYRSSFREQILNSIKAEGKTRRIIGHELFGEVVKVGSKANKKAPFPLKTGDFVSAESHIVCDKCYQCLKGEQNVCTNEKILGISYDGCFAEYIKIPARVVWKTDVKKIRREIAATQEPFGNAVHAASKVPLKGKTIAIFGLGPIGMFLTLIAKGLGAKKIIGVDPNEKSARVAKKLGIDELIIPHIPSRAEKTNSYAHNSETAKKILKLTNGVGADVTFEMSGNNSALNTSLYSVRRGGDLIAFGIKNADFTIENYNSFILRGVTIRAVVGRQIFQTWETTKRLLENPKNGIQKKIWEIMLMKGKGTILPISKYDKKSFEEKLLKYPKILIDFCS